MYCVCRDNMSDYTEQAAIGTGEEARSEVESEEEPVTVPSMLKDLDDVNLNEWDEDDSVEDLLKSEFATSVEEVQGTVLTDGDDAEAIDNEESYTDHAALTEHDPDTVDPEAVALESLQKKAKDGELDGTTTVDNRGEVVMDAIERATKDVRSKDTADQNEVFREAVSHATEMATSKIEAAELAGDYVLKVTDDTKTAVQARKEAVLGFSKARQYVSSYEDAPDDVNVKEGENGSLYYDPQERGRGNNETTGPVDNDLLGMDRDELGKAMELDPNDPDTNFKDAQREARAEKAIRTVAEAFGVEVGRVARFFKEARERGVTDAQSLVKQAEVVFRKQSFSEGDEFYSDLNDTSVTVVEIDGDEAHISNGEGDNWTESVEDVEDKISDGDWTHVEDTDETAGEKATDPDELEDPDDDGEEELDIEGDPDEIEDPDDDGEEELDVDPSMDDPDDEEKQEAEDIDHELVYEVVAEAYDIDPEEAEEVLHNGLDVEEKQEDPCWEGYTMVGTKENGDPRCVPEDEADNYDPEKSEDGLHVDWEKQDDDPCWDGYVQVGMKEGEDGEPVPNCVPEDEADKMVENAVEAAFSEDTAIEAAIESAFDGDTDFSKDRRYVEDPDDVPEGYEVQEGQQGGYYYETGGGGEEESGGEEGMSDEEQRELTSEAMHEIAEIDGAMNISGEERGDGYGITMDVDEDADPSQVATQVASVDGTANITGEENDDGTVSISMDIDQPVDDMDNPVDGNEESNVEAEAGRAMSALQENVPEERMDTVNEVVDMAMEEDDPDAIVSMAEMLVDDFEAEEGNSTEPGDDNANEEPEGGDTELPDAIGDPSEEEEQELRDRTQDMIDEGDIQDRVNDFSAPMLDGEAAGAEARNEVANRIMGEITQGDDLPVLRGGALEAVQGEVYDAVEEVVDEEMGTDLAMSVEESIDAGVQRAFEQ